VQVFISYAQRDRQWAMQLSEQLGALGIRPWLDSAEVFPGENWASAVGSALESSDALLVLVSPASADSEFVRREVQYALGSERFENRVIPVILEPTDQMPWILGRFQSVSGSPAVTARKVAEILSSTSSKSPAALADTR
jgi:hypothetical protein